MSKLRNKETQPYANFVNISHITVKTQHLQNRTV